MNFNNLSIRSYLATEPSEEEVQSIKEFSVSIIRGIKNGDEYAFDEFLNILDVKKYINGLTRNIYNKFDGNVGVNVIKNELNILIYHFIKTNYRIYNKPNEIQLVLVAMYGWLGGKASKSIYNNLNNKNDEYLGCWDMMERDMLAEVELKVALEQELTKDEYKLFTERYVNGKTFEEIANEFGISSQAVHKRNNALLTKIKGILFN